MEILKKRNSRHTNPVSHQAPQPDDWPQSSVRGAGCRPVRRRLLIGAAIVFSLIGIIVSGFFTFQHWGPLVRRALASGRDGAAATEAVHEEQSGKESEASHAHASDAGGIDAGSNSLVLTEKGRKNVGLTLVDVQLRDFARTISVPAMLAERSGRTKTRVAAPMTGIVTRIFPIRGEAVEPGQPLVELRLTHEDLVDKQSDLLRELEELDVVRREVARLREVTANGAVAGKRLLEQQYEQSKIEAAIRAGTQALILHGLAQEEVDRIVTDRRLVQDITITAPRAAGCGRRAQHPELFQVAALSVEPGEHVNAGRAMLTLTDHCELYIEGKAFEQDAAALGTAAKAATPVTAAIDTNGSESREVENLHIEFVENAVERNSRALKFYVRLPNELVRDEVTPGGHRFVGWRYRPGQRVQLYVPVETWQSRIVLPVEAAIQEGAEWYVFRQSGSRFERVPVHVEYRDQRFAVVENDGTLFPGDAVAASGAYQMHLALKNKAGGGVDPHAGHHH